VDDPADPMQVVQADQHLLPDLLADLHWNALVLIPLDDFQQVDTQDLEDHANMFAMRTPVQERVEQLHHVAVFAGHIGTQQVLVFPTVVLATTFDPVRVPHIPSHFQQYVNFVIGRL